MYILSALFFFLAGLALALIMKIQLMLPMNHFVSQDAYNQIFTMHGTTMIFLMGMPLLLGFSGLHDAFDDWGARDMAFPRLNAMGFWLFFFGALLALFQLCRRRRPSSRLVLVTRP